MDAPFDPAFLSRAELAGVWSPTAESHPEEKRRPNWIVRSGETCKIGQEKLDWSSHANIAIAPAASNSKSREMVRTNNKITH